MNDYTIKSVLKKIYSIDYNNINLENNTELIISSNTNDFHQLLFMNNEITNTHLIPTFETETRRTQTGLFYKDNTIYNHPLYGDPLISFRLSITGIKQSSFYRLRFITSPVETYVDDISSKVYIVINGKDIIYNKEITKNDTNIDHIFYSEATVLNIAVTIGKVIIKDIIFEEVEVMEEVQTQQTVVEIPDLMNLKAYSVFYPRMLAIQDKVISKFPLVRGIGLNILYDKNDDVIIVERNKENDVIQDNIGYSKYLIDVKLFNSGEISDFKLSEEPSPFSGAGGYLTFRLDGSNKDTIIYVLIYELL